MVKRTYNCTIDDLQIEDDGETVVLPIEAQETLGLKENDQVVMKKINTDKNLTIFEIQSNEN
jgi:bifunctional DNA-binding transcriptional regulator/antitoxin component of YhaV-PrlF toxin-antitoxin module|tara:strand:- start:72 stop:257 length:186 start_codon:yes stop_codon:yes gene_type:complete